MGRSSSETVALSIVIGVEVVVGFCSSVIGGSLDILSCDVEALSFLRDFLTLCLLSQICLNRAFPSSVSNASGSNNTENIQMYVQSPQDVLKFLTSNLK